MSRHKPTRQALLARLLWEADAARAANDLPRVVARYRQVLRLQPDFAEVWSNLAVFLLQLHDLDEALAAAQRAIDLRPDIVAIHGNLATILLIQGRVEESVAVLRRAVQLDPHYQPARHNLLFTLNYLPDPDHDAIYAEHAAWGREQLADPRPHANDRDPGRRLRIGYVSPDFRQHVVRRYIEPVLRHHDPAQVEVHCYAEVHTPDAVTARLQALVPWWRFTCGHDAASVAAQIRGDGIDILVDLAGHSGGNRLDVFALKPAPIQATMIGYVNTTGLPAMDYRITEAVSHPPGGPLRDTEELWRLPCGLGVCIAPPDVSPDVGPLPALRTGQLTFGSPHGLAKLNARVLDLWAEVLRALPGSRLLLMRDALTGSARQTLLTQFAARGIAPERLELTTDSGAVYLARHADIDVMLDSFPYTGGTSTFDSLWLGVPMLTLAGQRPAERISAAILSTAGLYDWITTTPAAYVARAVATAAELPRLAVLRGCLRERLAATVGDAGRFTRELEAAYRAMWTRWCICPPAR